MKRVEADLSSLEHTYFYMVEFFHTFIWCVDLIQKFSTLGFDELKKIENQIYLLNIRIE